MITINIYFKILTVLLMFNSCLDAFPQNLNEQELKEIKEVIEYRIKDFARMVQIISNDNNSIEIRETALARANSLFDENALVEETMQNSHKVIEYKINDYLNRLEVIGRYDKVIYEFRDFSIAKIRQTNDERGLIVSAEACFIQEFTGTDILGNIRYADNSTKIIDVEVRSTLSYSSNTSRRIWNVKLLRINVMRNIN